ncbi:DNA polymerase III subunit alpha [Egibacter rhizosphaerae]|uniref:DNA polymerase III subunit alpha n=1 Tax=Egibacter rhizosphaerae TaxID=1670831 RepID=UPI00197B00B6|nr:DNA polymerase III subunit alpha [Egibacter rhizosphaerae]
MEPFVHLAARSCWSMRDGVLRPDELAEATAARGMAAVGVADRDGLPGAVRFARACERTGVRPIFGADLALAPYGPDLAASGAWRGRRTGRHRAERTSWPRSGPSWLEGDPARVVLIARDAIGYAALCRLVSAHHLDSAPAIGAGSLGGGAGTYEPRASPAHLTTHLGGARGHLFVLFGNESPCARLLDAGERDAAAREARWWGDLVGADHVLVGVTHHLARGDDARARERFALADRLGLRAVAHQEPRYRDPRDAAVADTLDAIRQQVPLSARHHQRRNAEGYLKSPEEMAAVFAERPDALTATAWVAERCEVDLGLDRLRVPELADDPSMAELGARCRGGLDARRPWEDPGEDAPRTTYFELLDRELAMVAELGLAAYFLTVAEVVDRIRAKDVLVACRGSAAGSVVCYALGISDVDPVRHDLCFERFMNPYRDELPDIDLDVESARREDVYRDLLATYGPERVVCVTMVETFKARMAVREVGKAMGLPVAEVDRIAKAFPHIRARDVRAAIDHLPELAGRGLDAAHLQLLFDVVERLDGLPRHLALHPSGILLGPEPKAPGSGDGRGGVGAGSGDGLRDLVPVQPSAAGFAMAQFDKDDVGALGLCKLDVLAVRMLSAMAHAREEVRVSRGVDLDLGALPDGDPATYELIRSTDTLGMFQIESPGQRELLGRLQPEQLEDLVVDISLFRPGPVKGDMVGPFLMRRLGQAEPVVPHPTLERALGETFGVIVYHEQVMRCVAAITGCDLSTADLVRRRLGDPEEVPRLRDWVLGCAAERGIPEGVATSLWDALAQFASFGFCKAHAAAFAVPTYRSAYLKAHFLPELVAGLLTHDPGMYPRRLLLEDARRFGVAVLPVDVNRSERAYRVERVPAAQAWAALGVDAGSTSPEAQDAALPLGWIRADDGMPVPPGTRRIGRDLGAVPDAPGERFAIRVGLQDVAGIDDAMIDALLAGRPFTGLADLRERGGLSRPVAEDLAHVGALDGLAHPGASRRDVLLEVAERWAGARRRRTEAEEPEQLDLLGPGPAAGLGDYRPSEQVRAELEVLGLDVSRHVIRFYEGLLTALEATRAVDLVDCRDRQRVRIAGVKVATQTPPVQSGQRVIFLSLDDATGVGDAAFFESVHDRCASTVFHSWLLVVEGIVRRTGARGVSLNADAAWDLRRLMRAWRAGRLAEAVASGRRGDRSTFAAGEARPVDPEAVRSSAARLRVPRTNPHGGPVPEPEGASEGPEEFTAQPPRRLWHRSPGSAG